MPGGQQQLQRQEQQLQQQKSTTTPTPVPTTTQAPGGEQKNSAPGERLQQREQKATPTPTSTATPTPTPIPTATPGVEQKTTVPAERLQQKGTPTSTATPMPNPTPTPTSAGTPTPQPTGTPTPGATPVPGTKQMQRGSDVPAGTQSTATPTPTPGGGAALQKQPDGTGGQTGLIGTRHGAPTNTQPIPPPPAPAQPLAPIAQGAAASGPRNIDEFRSERRETEEGGRRVFNEPGRVIVVDPSGQSFIRHNEQDRFRFGARDIQTQQVGGETRTIVIRPDGSQIITVVGRDGQLLRRVRRDERGREIIIIDNSYRDPRAIGGFYVELPPPVLRIPYDRYIVDAEDAPPQLIYDTMEAPPVDRIERRYSLDEIRYSPSVRQLMPSIDLNSINFQTGSWEIPPDQAAKLQSIADGLNRAIQRNPREVFLIEGHTDAVGNDVDNLSLSDRRAESAATLLTQQFQVPAENLTSQGYGSQYLKEQTSGPSRINRRVTVRRITPLLNGDTASLPPPPPGTAPQRR